MLRYITILYISLLSVVNTALAQEQVSITIEDRSYRNQEIRFFSYEDMLTKTPALLAKSVADSLGKIEVSFPLDETQEIFALAGRYKLKLYAEPGKTYQLAVPPYLAIGLADELNPFFEPDEVFAGLKNTDENELNRKIARFDSYFDNLLEKHFNYLYTYRDIKMVDSLITDVDSLFPAQENQYLEAYKSYKKSYFKYFSVERDPQWAAKQYFLNKPILYKNSAYMHFFTQLFKSYFSKDLHTEFHTKLRENIIYDKSSRLLKQTMDQSIALRNDTLKELIILQGLFDCFADKQNYLRRTVYQTLDSLETETHIPYHAEIAKNIRDTVFRLKPGDIAPDFSFKTIEGEDFTLSKQKGSFIYLNVCRSENYACVEDYKLIKDIADKQLPDLQVVTVSFDQNLESLRMFNRAFPDFTWKFVYGDNKSFLSDYQVRVMPSYFLIDPEGRIVMLPAASPHENFKAVYGAIWNSFRQAKLREQKNKQH